MVCVPTDSSSFHHAGLGNLREKRELLYIYKLEGKVSVRAAWVSCPHLLTMGMETKIGQTCAQLGYHQNAIFDLCL